MQSFDGVFERTEIKYRLTARQHHFMRTSLSSYLAPDAYGRTSISSVYYDTPDHQLIERSLDKPLYKEKLRIRGYGPRQRTERVFVELKKKFDGIVYKRRVPMSREAAEEFLGGSSYQEACSRYPLENSDLHAESLSRRSLQIAAEIGAFVKRYPGLRPSMLITCERTAWTPIAGMPGAEALGPQGIDLRITFDERIRYRKLAWDEDLGRTEPLIVPGEAVMEIKVRGPYPMWLVKALDDCCAYPQSYSKYGSAYCREEQ